MTPPTVTVRQPIQLAPDITATITLELAGPPDHTAEQARLVGLMISALAAALAPFSVALNHQERPESLELLGMPEAANWLRTNPEAYAAALKAAHAPSSLLAALRPSAGGTGS